MRNTLFILLCAIPFVFSPNTVWAHGSSTYGTAHSSEGHAEHSKEHIDRSIDGIAEALEEMHVEMDEMADQLYLHDQRIRIADVLGGIGYIVGITGVAYYYLGARRRKQQ